jgi:glutamate-ammonia-ligase adenylyltransferase
MASLTELAKLGFTDLESTVGKLDSLVSMVGDSGRSALAQISQSANPDQALNALLDLASADRTAIKKLLGKPESALRLVLTLGASSALVDFLRRHIGGLRMFDRQTAGLPTIESLRLKFSQAVKGIESAEQGWVQIRLAYREELIRVAAHDLTSDSVQELPVIAAALADMAGAAIDAGLEVARWELINTQDHGAYSREEVKNTKLAVIAMGKCGARELNYISDVDVLYVAEAGDDLDSARALEIATRLATRMMRAMDANASEPALWQVDPNLRPEGKSGALVRTLESHVSYYERWAENWEFQALLKARPLAGDLELGEAYVQAVAPMIWASSARDGFVESARKMRERVMEHIPTAEVDRQIKLGPGGLRDVEFTVQLLQLVHGRSDESVRVRDTLGGIEALTRAGYLARSDASSFSNHYRWLRVLEHRIQLSGMRRTHLMPNTDTALRALARSIDAKMRSDTLLERWSDVKTEVRSLHQKVFYRPLLNSVASASDSSFALTSSQALDRLAAIGFADPKSALVHIEALTSGLSRRAAIQKQLLPVLLEWFAQGSDPDQALLAFRRLSEDLGESHWYLRMLRDSNGAAERMTTVLSNSRLATHLFENHPEAAAWFENNEDLSPSTSEELDREIDSISDRHESLDAAADRIRSVRRRETLRLAMGAVIGELTIAQISKGLSDLTASYLQGLLKLIVQSHQADIAQQIDFGIVAMGRFGGEELGFGSDADVMFVYEPKSLNVDQAQKVAEALIAELKRLATDPILEFELDLDLRPEGKNGPVARSLDSYRAYYERWADTWEAQALLRARFIAGSEELQSEFVRLINQYRYPQVLDNSAIVEIRRIKARVETERLPQGADPKRHLKLGRGSLSDVEWLVQLMQLRHGNKHPEIRTPQTLQALVAFVSEGLMQEHDATVLREAWLLASRVRSASVLWANRKTDVLPTDRKALEGISRILEYPAGSATALEQDYLSFTRRSRMVFERLFYSA